jgi:UPF0176 protein
MADNSPRNAPVTVVALYHFTRLENFTELREPLLDLSTEQGIKGTLLLAHEGINGTVAGTAEAIQALVAYLRSLPAFSDLEVKYSHALEMPFHRLKVRLKKEIVTMGIEDVDPLKSAGTYVMARDWNALISDPDTVIVDTRNDYEVKLGTFRKAINPNTKSFSEFPQWIEQNRSTLEGKKVAMFCTGGIRCEKATAYAKSVGLEEVYHLKGGILKYLEEVSADQSLWDGECFVFDERVSVGHSLAPGDAVLCRACRMPLAAGEIADPAYVEGVSCPHCISTRSAADRLRYAERHKQVQLHEKRGAKPHIGG